MKLKTHKSTAKKVRVTKGKRHKKFVMRHAGQDHFNARESGNATRHKRTNVTAAKADRRNISSVLPYA